MRKCFCEVGFEMGVTDDQSESSESVVFGCGEGEL